MIKKRPILTAVINVHREGPWAFKACRSAIAALRKFKSLRPDDDVEIVVVADKADDATVRCVKQALEAVDESEIDWWVAHANVGDLGLARNVGVAHAKGRFVAFLDGDDCWGEDWPALGVAALERTQAAGCVDCAAHPHTNVDFGDGAFWWTQPDQRSDEFDPSTFWVTNCWSSGAMAAHSVLLAHPYRRRTEGLGFEDWEWNARTVAAGVLHVSVPGAVVFIRKKNDGLNADSARKRQLVAHSEYFETPPEMLPRHRSVPMPDQPSDPGWLKRQWKAINEIEPALWPDARRVQGLPRYKAHGAPVVPGTAMLIARKAKARPTHVILAPALVRGGADKRIVAYAAAVVRAGGYAIIITTDRQGDESWADALPEGVHVMDAAAVLRRCGDDGAILLLSRLLMRWKPVVHVVNSRLGYEIVRRHGASLKDSGVPAIYCSLYGTESTRGEPLGGAAFNGWFEGASKYVDRVITDNSAHAEQLRGTLAWDRTTVVPSIVDVLSPEDLRILAAERASPKRLPAMRVLWASRGVKGKRLDRLLAIAKKAHEDKLPIVFAVAGEPLDRHAKKAIAGLQQLPNVKVSAKAFDGWRALVPARQDLFVFTSEAEGMPNVVLEALALGIPVVSTAVGDVPTLPADAVSIVRDADDPAAWLEAVADLHLRAKPIQEWVRHNHSEGAFDAALASAGYMRGLDGKRREHGSEGGDREGAEGPGGLAGQVGGEAHGVHQAGA